VGVQGTGLVTGRKYVEPKHGPQYTSDAPKDFPRVVNGVPTTGGGDYEATDLRSSIPPSPSAAGLTGTYPPPPPIHTHTWGQLSSTF